MDGVQGGGRGGARAETGGGRDRGWVGGVRRNTVT